VHRRYTHIDVGRWLNGRQPRGIVPEIIADVLSAKLGRPVTVADLGMSSGGGVALARAADYTQSLEDSITAIGSVVQIDRPGDELSGVENVDAAAWADLMVQWLLAPDGAPPVTSLVFREKADGLRLATEMFSQMDYRFGGGYARSALVEFVRAEVGPLLADPGTWSGEVLRSAAALLRLVGWTAYDTGHHGLATRYFTQGLRLAQESGDRALGGRILAGMSHQANFLGYHSHAVNLARAAVRGAHGHATPTAMALFHAMEARGLAGTGDRSGAEAALAMADTWFDRRSTENDPEWLRYFDAAELAAEFAHSYRDLGMADHAVQYGQIAVADADPRYVRSIAFCQLVVAAGYVGQGEIEHGLRIADDGVAAVAGLRSVRSQEYVRDFLARLQPLQGQDLGVDGFIQRAKRSVA
jgi:hypothetical protein